MGKRRRLALAFAAWCYRNMRKMATLTGILLAGALAAGAAGCANGDEKADSTPTATVTETASAAPLETKTNESETKHGHAYAPFASTDKVLELAEKVKSEKGGELIALDTDNREKTLKVKTYANGEKATTIISADGNSLLDKEKERKDVALAGLISLSDALDKAGVAKDGSTYLDEAELDEDDGVYYWEIDLDDADGHDLKSIKVDAKTGEVVKEKNER